MDRIWKELELAPTDDVKEIKKAYAKQVSKYHPEENPEKFQSINQAYKEALQIVRGRQTEEPSNIAIKREEPFEEEAEDNLAALTEQYVREEEELERERQEEDAILVEQAIEDLGIFAKSGKMQTYGGWRAYLQSQMFLNIARSPQFLEAFFSQIQNKKIKTKVAELIRSVFDNEIPPGTENKQQIINYLDDLVERQKQVKHRILGGAIIPFILILVGVVFQLVKMPGTDEKEEIEEYISEKYNISATVEKSDPEIISMKGELSYPSEDMRYYRVKTNDNGAPESFSLQWPKSSEDHKDIEDNLEYKTLKMYSHYNTLKIQTMGTTVMIEETSLEEEKPKFITFLRQIQDSKFVQAGYEMKIVADIYLSENSSTGMSSAESQYVITIKADTEIDEDEVNKGLDKALEGAKKMESPIVIDPYEYVYNFD